MEVLGRNCVHLFRFKEVWLWDPKYDNILRNLWNEGGATGHHKLKVTQRIEDSFREYKVGTTFKEIKRIEALLKENSNWAARENDLNQYKALEIPRNNFMLVEETISR